MAQTFEYRDGMHYGSGINKLNSEVTGDAVIKTTPQSISMANGQEITFRLQSLDSIHQLHSSLGISASSSGNYGAFSGSGKYKFASESNFNSFSVFLLVQSIVTNAFREMDNVQLKDAAIDQFKNSAPEQVRAKYGDGFVRGMKEGGEFHGIIEILTTSASEKQEIAASASMNFSGVGSGGQGSASYSKKLEEITKNKQVRITVSQKGGDTSNTPDTIAEMIEHAVTFPEQVKSEAVSYSALVLDYVTTDNFPQVPSQQDLINAESILDSLSETARRLQQKYNDIMYIFTNTSEFEAVDVTKLNEQKDTLTNLLNKISKSASEISKSPIGAQLPNLGAIPAFVLPKRIAGPRKTRLGWAEAGWRKQIGRPFTIIMSSSPPPYAEYQDRIYAEDLVQSISEWHEKMEKAVQAGSMKYKNGDVVTGIEDWPSILVDPHIEGLPRKENP